MSSKLGFLVRSALLLAILPCVVGDLYITHPLTSTTCTGGKQCEVNWVDDGVTPPLSAIGSCYVGLYNSNGDLVQQIEPVDVASVHSLTFTPDTKAGPDSNKYYINFTSTDPSKQYHGFSTFFTLTGMSGSLSHPNPSDTSAISVPSTVASPPSQSIQTTITVGAPQSSGTSSGSISGSSPSPSAQSTSQASSNSSSISASSSASSSTFQSSTALALPSSASSQASSIPSTSSESGVSSTPSSFITIRTSASSASTPSATTLIVSLLPTDFLSTSSGASATGVPSAATGASQTSGASSLKHGHGQGLGMFSVALGAVAVALLTWI